MDPLEVALSARCADVSRVRDYYLPVASFCRSVLRDTAKRPVFVGLNGPQGAGKSTLADAVVQALEQCDGVRGIAISIDDFYLTHDAQRALAARFPDNPCLAYRGYPGTHDVELGCTVLDALSRGASTSVPTYDKSAHGGRGDRAPEESFRRVEGALDLVILEGWMLGFRPVDATLEPDLRAPNEMLAAYARWDAGLDALVRLDARALEDIVRWRVDSERARRERGEGALSDADARDYIERFMPAYRAYVPGLRAHPPCARVLAVELDRDRRATAIR